MLKIFELTPRWWTPRRGGRRWFVGYGPGRLGVTLLCDNSFSVRWVPWDELQRNWKPWSPESKCHD